ncbi:NAD(P)-binding protein [Myriangium duriaei CBS 260.36]|uniref:NAD(P)-binding protein n=1 Tax=Myriangium duriaei CBS 260.36 TaxID=1168546 RepID=A0A9P4MDR2_9PEZI|nr:NAD(P)-binding protein [Myriangium duriaei CBS 260.36]
MTSRRRILVTGATGKQGGALIKALLSKPTNDFEIYALTRDIHSNSAKQLSKQDVHLIEGNLDNVEAIFGQVTKPVWGVFSVPILDRGTKKEELQSKSLTKAAVASGVSHIVFTATDRGGQEESENNPTSVPHFASKFRIEEDIKSTVSASGGALTYTFLRPVAFYENISNNFLGRAFVSMWRLNGDTRKLQMISTSDIGEIAAEAFLHAKEEEFCNKAISLAGDELSPADAARIFQEETGRALPQTYQWLGWALRYMIPDLRHMFAWFRSTGFGADLQVIKNNYPFVADFRTWLRDNSDWARKS